MQLKADALLLAALALPGLGFAAGTAPVDSVLEMHLAHYEDQQPGASRMQVVSPSLYWLTPVTEDWSVASTFVLDSLSGASPLYHDTLSGASGVGIDDFRRAADIEVTRYFGLVEAGVGVAVSNEADYDSVALRAAVRMDSEDRNHTWTLAAGGSNDHIDSVNGLAQDRFRRVRQVQLGWTRVLDPKSLISFDLTWTDSAGYHDDPYKPLDFRPDRRQLGTFTSRYRRFLEGPQATLRIDLRLYDDDWSVSAQSVDLAWEQVVNPRISITPHLRLHNQSAAFFYVDPPFGSGFELGQPYSADSRLAAFGAYTVGVEGQLKVSDQWSAQLGFDFYRQDTRWRLATSGSAQVKLVSARIWQLGLRRQW